MTNKEMNMADLAFLNTNGTRKIINNATPVPEPLANNEIIKYTMQMKSKLRFKT